MLKRIPKEVKNRRNKRVQSEQATGNIDKGIGLTDTVEKDIKTIVSLHLDAELKVSHYQRFLEMITAHVSHPLGFCLMILFIVLWIAASAFGAILRLNVFDPAPYYWLQGIVGLNALVITILVIGTQHRQGKLVDRWRHLELQVSLLMEHKVSKMIALIEELRRDIPNVEDRHDAQAVEMEKSIDTRSLFASLNETLDEVVKEVEQSVFHQGIDGEKENSATSPEVEVNGLVQYPGIVNLLVDAKITDEI